MVTDMPPPAKIVIIDDLQLPRPISPESLPAASANSAVVPTRDEKKSWNRAGRRKEKKGKGRTKVVSKKNKKRLRKKGRRR